MLDVVDLRKNPERYGDAVARPTADPDRVRDVVRDLIADVRARGDEALLELTERFDDVRLPRGAIQASGTELSDAWKDLDVDVRRALEVAAGRIRAYQRRESTAACFDEDDVVVEDREIPVGRAGIYVPGGLATYPSTVLMAAIPAQVAGVPEIALCVPPSPDGSVPLLTAAAAHLLGLGEVYKVGGVQAIAALAYGTESIRPVDKIVGPGNAYVVAAKAEVASDVGVESLAGPSECVIVADAGAPPDLVALDLVAQAEHGPGGFCVLVTWADALAERVCKDVEALAAASPRRDAVRATLEAGGRIVLCAGVDEALELVDAMAAEHVQLMVAEPRPLADAIRNAGAIFCGYDTPVALGDYVAGPSHVLPTGGTARFASALRPADFRKSVHVITATPAGLAKLGPAAATLADAEGLPGHAETVRRRLRRRA